MMYNWACCISSSIDLRPLSIEMSIDTQCFSDLGKDEKKNTVPKKSLFTKAKTKFLCRSVTYFDLSNLYGALGY